MSISSLCTVSKHNKVHVKKRQNNIEILTSFGVWSI